MDNTHRVDVGRLIDANQIGKFQWMVLILCGACMVVDGFDVQAMGYVAPAIIQDWGIDKSALGPVFGAGLLGLLLGSLIFSMLADKIGRRPILIGATLFFAVCMLATPLARTLDELKILRLITGLGLGAIMPNAMALCGEFSPMRRRISIMMMISCGFTVGAMLGGLIAAAVIPLFGWESVFYIGGTVPLVIAVLMMRYLPESIQFQVVRAKDPRKIGDYLKRIDPTFNYASATVFVVADKPNSGAPVLDLFKDGRAMGTLSLWLISFMNMIALYFLSNWLPTVAKSAGLAISTAVLLGTMLQFGGTLGTLSMGVFIDKLGFRRVLVPCFLVAGVAVALIGQATGSMLLLFTVVFITGFAVVGGQPAINAMAANFYPTTSRSTGVGWSLGVGRIGSIVGPVVGGELIRLDWSLGALFGVVALPSFVILVVVLAARGMYQPASQAQL